MQTVNRQIFNFFFQLFMNKIDQDSLQIILDNVYDILNAKLVLQGKKQRIN